MLNGDLVHLFVVGLLFGLGFHVAGLLVSAVGSLRKK